MTVHSQADTRITMVPSLSRVSAESRAMMSVSAAGLQKSLLQLLRHATLQRLGRILLSLLRCNMRESVHHWYHQCVCLTMNGAVADLAKKSNLSDQKLAAHQAAEIAKIRDQWSQGRTALVKSIGYEQDDHIAVSREDVGKLRQLDTAYRDQLNQAQQKHLDNSNKFNVDKCKLRGAALIMQKLTQRALGAELLAEREERSRETSGRAWEMDDMCTNVLQWSYTQEPDPCMVPFPVHVGMKDQQKTLAETCKCIFEYADKLPRWAHLATANHGRVCAKDYSVPAATHLMKSILRRVQECNARQFLREAFEKIVQHSQSPHSFRAAKPSVVGREGWKKVRSALEKDKLSRRSTKQAGDLVKSSNRKMITSQLATKQQKAADFRKAHRARQLFQDSPTSSGSQSPLASADAKTGRRFTFFDVLMARQPRMPFVLGSDSNLSSPRTPRKRASLVEESNASMPSTSPGQLRSVADTSPRIPMTGDAARSADSVLTNPANRSDSSSEDLSATGNSKASLASKPFENSRLPTMPSAGERDVVIPTASHAQSPSSAAHTLGTATTSSSGSTSTSESDTSP